MLGMQPNKSSLSDPLASCLPSLYHYYPTDRRKDGSHRCDRRSNQRHLGSFGGTSGQRQGTIYWREQLHQREDRGAAQDVCIRLNLCVSKTALTLYSRATIQPAVNQIEAHPYLQQRDLLEWSKQKVSTLNSLSISITFNTF